MNAQEIILKPLLSEKSYAGIADKVYTFVVATKANKTEIKNAVEELFEVEVESVRTARVHGKKKRMGRYEGTTSSYKKAVVTLKSSSKAIAFFESLS
ncbi:MAG: 50S ribosomal protein L23 [Clostridia bacterium]|nr:50S ribosomal protein L23 [Clostridia bacterium]MBQ1943028.1 50S ribosomal protein L23 [Clostridia bacterium]